ncbi:MAG: prenyltransferase [Candidatus Lernaella stagnicola]|nr:prenyltransferase [Candidatus Lernaella stagnicola]
MKRWLRAVGFYRGFLLTSFMPVSLGATLAWWEGARFHWPLAVATMVAVWLFHAGTNLLNDYYDHLSGTDDINEIRTPFSGGTRVIQEGLLSAEQIRAAGYACFALGLVLFAVLSLFVGWWLWALALFGLLSGWGYTAKPLWLAYRGWGELMIALNFGPALVLTGYYAQTQEFGVAAVWVGCAMGFWTAAIITINQLPDFVADKLSGKRNLVVRWGKRFGLQLWAALILLSLATIIAGVFLGLLPAALVLGLLVTPLVVRLIDRGAGAVEGLEINIAVSADTIKYEILFWVFLMGGLLASRLPGVVA